MGLVGLGWVGVGSVGWFDWDEGVVRRDLLRGTIVYRTNYCWQK